MRAAITRSVWCVTRMLPLAVLAGCEVTSPALLGGGSGPISIEALAGQVSLVATGDDLSVSSEKSITQLADDIADVMASKGNVSGDGGELDPFADHGLDPESITSWLWTPGLAQASRPEGTVFASPAPDGVFGSSPPRPPLGITCVWDVTSVGWGFSESIFGAAPDDGIRFELYEVANGLPIEPLDPLATVVDVRPRLQSSETGEALNVVVDVPRKNTSSNVLSYVLAGNSNDTTNVIDLLMAGDKTSSGGSLLDFVLAIDGERSTTSIRVDDLIMSTSIEVVGGTATAYLAVRKVGSPRQSVEFDFTLSESTTIGSGVVVVDSEVIAEMTGPRLTPTWTVMNGRFTENENLNVLYDSLLLIDSSINSQFFFSHCVGADRPRPCADMLIALGL